LVSSFLITAALTASGVTIGPLVAAVLYLGGGAALIAAINEIAHEPCPDKRDYLLGALIGGAVGGGLGAKLGGRLGAGLRGSTAKGVTTQFEKKIEQQMGKRGWDKDSINSTIDNPNKTVKTKDTRWGSDGTRRNDPATAYIREDGHYVVRNDNDGTIVQISNRNKPDWKSPFEKPR
jgi:Colicin E5 ribonuclease domain